MMRRPLALASLILAAPVAAEIRLTEERVGPFTIVREDYRNTGTPIMHVPNEWTKVRLLWTSTDGLAELQLEDDGFTLKGMFSARAPGAQGGCSRIGALHAYGAGAPTGVFWRANGRQFSAFLRGCASVARTAADRYMAEYEAAAPRFSDALARMRTLATAAFGSTERRCIAFGEIQYYSGIPGRTCARWSGPRNGRR